MLQSQESRRHSKAGEERGGEADEGTEGWRWRSCLAGCAAIVLYEGGGTQGSASRTAVLLGFGSNNHKARISIWSFPNPPSLHLPPPTSPALMPPGFYLQLNSTIYTTKHVHLDIFLVWLFYHEKNRATISPVAVTHPMFSHQVEERKWAYDKRPVISTLYVILMDRFYLSHLSAAETKDIFLEDGKLLDRGKKPDPGAFLQTVSIYTRWPFQSGRHTIFAHLLNPLSSAPRRTALYSPSCRKRRQSL